MVSADRKEELEGLLHFQRRAPDQERKNDLLMSKRDSLLTPSPTGGGVGLSGTPRSWLTPQSCHLRLQVLPVKSGPKGGMSISSSSFMSMKRGTKVSESGGAASNHIGPIARDPVGTLGRATWATVVWALERLVGGERPCWMLKGERGIWGGVFSFSIYQSLVLNDSLNSPLGEFVKNRLLDLPPRYSKPRNLGGTQKTAS